MSYSESERKLTNDDFRKLFMTPRHSSSSSGHHGSSTSNDFATPAPPDSARGDSTIRRHHHDKEKHEQRKKKKQFYSKIKKEEDEQMAELARKYRDRAKERREGGLPDTRNEELISAQGAYRAVAPDFRGNVDAAERRKQIIQESKFLGGDMEHTHLVKGLDYALLQKVRSETHDPEEGDEAEGAVDTETAKSEEQAPVEKEAAPKEQDPEGFHTKLGRNIHRVVFKTNIPERNELFAPGRMAYVMELEDEFAESDIPHTMIRSKADVPNAQALVTLSTNDIVINKLAQILTYLRSGSKGSKKHKKTKSGKPEEKETSHSHHSHSHTHSHRGKNVEEDSIYGDIGDYVPATSKSSHRQSKESRPSTSSKKQYFEKPADEEDREVVLEMPRMEEAPKRDREAWESGDHNKDRDQTFGSLLKKDDKSQSRSQKLISKMNQQPEGYAECYPGFEEMHDALDDSDEETDFSKMDPGKKKGAVGRWDFDSVEEYSEYMSNKEALPKAAFQFGVKMNDGRKTRKNTKTEKNEKAQLDRQWQQIQAIMTKRKGGEADGEPVPKTPRV